jgi:hypothetical protein
VAGVPAFQFKIKTKMKKLIVIAGLVMSAALSAQTKPQAKAKPADSKLELDRAMIKSMSGIYKVSFNFAETFAADTGYKYYPRYNEWGIEYVFVAEETSEKIVLQHLLIANDTMIIKHWRQDWVYENREVYKYYKDNEWVKETLSPEQAKGTWTQKVFQVDDSPRYESYGTWLHVDGKHYWEGVNDAPLPRREYTKRDDYNVMRRHSRMEILPDGWMLEQDNEKVVRKGGMDKTICWEKGFERFTKGNYDATPATKWWEKQKQYWADVRKAWDEVYTKTPDLKLAAKVDNKRLYESLFALGDKVSQKSYAAGSAIPDIKKIIESFVKAA